jgi:two-component system cell cycle response regulator
MKKKNNDDTTRVTAMHNLSEGASDGVDCLVQIYGKALGKKYEMFEPLVTLGRDPQNSVVLESDSVSRRHAVIEITDKGRVLRDLDSTNGTYLNDIQIKSAVLSQNDMVKIGDTIFKFLSGNNIESQYHEEIYRMTIWDGLTQIANKRHLMDHLDKEFARCQRYNRNLSLVMFDIDFFKNVNDTYGHLTGDYVLKELSDLLRNRIRREELFARYGGEEFAIVLPESDTQVAARFADIIRAKVADHVFEFEGQQIKVTISLGVASMNLAMKTVSEFIGQSDAALYEAKRLGRNRVVVAGQKEEPSAPINLDDLHP